MVLLKKNTEDLSVNKLFLCSSFKDVAKLFANFAEDELVGKRVTFIPSASIVEKFNLYVKWGKNALEQLGLAVDELEISTAAPAEITGKLNSNDYIYVSGGNAFYLLQELKRTGADKIIAEQIAVGKTYIGESAGSIVVSPNIEYIKDMDDCNAAPELVGFDALNLVDFYPLPHHTNFPFIEAVEKIISKYGTSLRLVPISNSQVILVTGKDVRIL